jgi:hypothetical protein
MRGRGIAATLVAFSILAGGLGTVWAGSHEEKKMEGSDPMAWAKPGAAHKALEPMVGTFDTTTTLWFAPGQPPVDVKGTVESRWVLDGRYVESIHKSTVMNVPFEGRGLEGYDNLSQKYVSVWMDTLSTSPLTFTGTASADGKVFTQSGDSVDPMSGSKLTTRTVTTIVDKDNYRYESFITGPDGKEFKNVEVNAKRR